MVSNLKSFLDHRFEEANDHGRSVSDDKWGRPTRSPFLQNQWNRE
jgi:hypothetical protein